MKIERLENILWGLPGVTCVNTFKENTTVYSKTPEITLKALDEAVDDSDKSSVSVKLDKFSVLNLVKEILGSQLSGKKIRLAKDDSDRMILVTSEQWDEAKTTRIAFLKDCSEIISKWIEEHPESPIESAEYVPTTYSSTGHIKLIVSYDKDSPKRLVSIVAKPESTGLNSNQRAMICELTPLAILDGRGETLLFTVPGAGKVYLESLVRILKRSMGSQSNLNLLDNIIAFFTNSDNLKFFTSYWKTIANLSSFYAAQSRTGKYGRINKQNVKWLGYIKLPSRNRLRDRSDIALSPTWRISLKEDNSLYSESYFYLCNTGFKIWASDMCYLLKKSGSLNVGSVKELVDEILEKESNVTNKVLFERVVEKFSRDSNSCKTFIQYILGDFRKDSGSAKKTNTGYNQIVGYNRQGEVWDLSLENSFIEEATNPEWTISDLKAVETSNVIRKITYTAKKGSERHIRQLEVYFRTRDQELLYEGKSFPLKFKILGKHN